jgi:branched-chain amino acid transport system ATP-binding protein
MSAENPILGLRDVSTGYGTNQIVHEVSLDVQSGESVCIIGPNGAGKSTLLKTITGYLPCWSGSIEFKDENITTLETNNLVRRGLCSVGQGNIVFPDMTVKENLEMGAWTLEESEKEENMDKVFDLFPKIKDRLDQKADTMSGGEQQMLALARAMIVDPELLVLDEPSLGLSPKLVDNMFDHISSLQEEGLSILLVEQNAAKALRNTDRGYVLEMGEVAHTGKSSNLLEDDNVRELYLGG